MTTRSPYQSARVAIDARRANDAQRAPRIDGIDSHSRYLEQQAANRAQAEKEARAFEVATELLKKRNPVDTATLDLAVLYVVRHDPSVPPTLRYHEIPEYRIGCSLVRAAHRARADVLTADEIG